MTSLIRSVGHGSALLLLAGEPSLAAAWPTRGPGRVFTNAMACGLMFEFAAHFRRSGEGADWTLFVRRDVGGARRGGARPEVVGPGAYSAGGTNM